MCHAEGTWDSIECVCHPGVHGTVLSVCHPGGTWDSIECVSFRDFMGQYLVCVSCRGYMGQY